MPEKDYWSSFFDAECIIKKMFGPHSRQGDVVEFGSGYGTFTVPAARHSTGTVTALDIEADLIEQLRDKLEGLSIQNVQAEVRNFVAEGTGLEPETQSHAMIYNLLHLENPIGLLAEAHRMSQPGGALSIIHWRSDIPTPRGPVLDMRPTPTQCKAWIAEAGFRRIQDVDLSECCRYHFGIVAMK